MRDLMTGLARPMLRLLGRDDRGAVGLIVAVVLGGGVLIGMGALVVDVGQIYQNRAELQNGADAGALAVAKSCVLGGCDPALAVGQATANASSLTGHQAAVQTVCGPDPLDGCDFGRGGGITNCPPNPPEGAHYVDVRTMTKTPSGSVLPPVFARALVGPGNYSGTTVYACAQAEWGAPASATTAAFTISACEWRKATEDGNLFGSLPDPPQYADQSVILHSGSGGGRHGSGPVPGSDGCEDGPAHSDAPGAFGWLRDAHGTCQVTISGQTYRADTGVSAGKACKAALHQAWLNRTAILIPVYQSVRGSGHNTTYTLDGFAAFVVTGYRVPGATAGDWLNPAKLCSPPGVCIDGFFTHDLISSGSLSGGSEGSNLGVEVVKLTG